MLAVDGTRIASGKVTFLAVPAAGNKDAGRPYFIKAVCAQAAPEHTPRRFVVPESTSNAEDAENAEARRESISLDLCVPRRPLRSLR